MYNYQRRAGKVGLLGLAPIAPNRHPVDPLRPGAINNSCKNGQFRNMISIEVIDIRRLVAILELIALVTRAFNVIVSA